MKTEPYLEGQSFWRNWQNFISPRVLRSAFLWMESENLLLWLQYPTTGPHPNQLNAVDILVFSFVMTNTMYFSSSTVCAILLNHLSPGLEHTNNIWGSTDFEALVFFILLLLAIINLNILVENCFSNCRDLISVLIVTWQDIPWPYVSTPVTYPSGHSKSDVSYEHGSDYHWLLS